MLAKFTVSNFKGFNSDFVFDLTKVNAYEFNQESIKNNVVNNAIIYGKNGVGKSNLGLAIFDIVSHLTEYNSLSELKNASYLNAYSDSDYAKFRYEFLFGSDKVLYEYEKKNSDTLISEKFEINGVELAGIDRREGPQARIEFDGTETLNRELTNSKLSLLKYIKNNTQFDPTQENEIFKLFYDFVERMLFFRSLNSNMYLGLQSGQSSLQEDIIERGNVPDLEKFLNEAGIVCKLKVEQELDKEVLAFDFDGKTISLFDVASTGTKSLVLFYYWLQRLKETSKVSFLIIDEFDAFYHHELSAMVVERLKETGIQFILTTHNVSIMTNDLLRPDCYFLMKKDAIQSIARSTSKELREAHNLEKMYKADSFNVQ
ncbi:MAG: AAA family ATPase [Flavobacteriales bacterium]|nr:AAA family ATPase [Flavobacteriales bacterium]